MVFAKIHVENEEEKYDFVLIIDCPDIDDMEKIEKILQNFKNNRKNRFCGVTEYIQELDDHGYNANELTYPIEIL